MSGVWSCASVDRKARPFPDPNFESAQKMIAGRSIAILAGATASVTAVVRALAVDFPTKRAAPSDYAKICNVGGMAGFILPGSDTCFQVSGYIVAHIEGGNLKQGYVWQTAPGSATVALGPPTSTRSSFGWTTRLNVNLDARQDTAYGAVLSHVELQLDNSGGFDNIGTLPNLNRAYLRWAGMTAGKANSFFSFFDGGTAWANLFSPNQHGLNQPDLLAYTARLGGDFSATLALQSSGANGNGGGTNLAMPANASYLGMRAPDIVAVLRVDQSWGAAQMSGVAHQVRLVDETVAAHTQDALGWGVLGGTMIDLPMLGPDDDIQVQGVWTRNALWYSGIPDGLWGEYGAPNGNGLPMIIADAWSNGNGTWATPTAWSIEGFLEHYISQQLFIGPEASYGQLNWSGALGNVIPSNARSWIVGAAADWLPIPHLVFETELLYQDTRQSRPSGAGLHAPLTAFPNASNGFAWRFYVTRDF